MKTCTECKLEKQDVDFRKNGKGLRSKCKSCESKRDAVYNHINKDKRLAYKKNHPTTYVKSDRRAYYKAHKDKLLKQAKLYRETNSEKISFYKKKYRAEHPELNRHYKSLRRARSTKLSRYEATVARSYRLAISKDPCYYCGKFASIMHDDHYYPLSKGGTNHWYNLVRACHNCNGSKWNRCGTWFILRN